MNTNNKNLIFHIFSVVQTLEKKLSQHKEMLHFSGEKKVDAEKAIEEQARIVAHMRRVANKLQLEFAANNTSAMIRSLRIFYGLHHIVRPEILKAAVPVAQQPKAQSKLSNLQSSTIH